MKLIKQSAEIWEQPQGDLLLGVYQQIERAGRICYKSEDKITEDSAKPFVERMIASKHYAMLEHGTVYLAIPMTTEHAGFSPTHYSDNPYSIRTESTGFELRDEYNDPVNCWCVTTNLRVIIENGWEEDLEYICAPTKWHAKRVTVHCVTSRQIAMELIRHRVMSFAMESTRYCNYSKNKFNNELTFIQPLWDSWAFYPSNQFSVDSCLQCVNDPHLNSQGIFVAIEKAYFNLINYGWKPQEAAIILPNALKADIVITGFVDDWKHLFDLRVLGTTGAPHPQMKELMTPVYEEFIKRGYINDSKTEG